MRTEHGKIYVVDGEKARASVSYASGVKITLFLPISDNTEEEVKGFEKDREKLQKQVNISRGKLDNKKFLEKAPQFIIDKERHNLKENEKKLNRVEENLKSLQIN